eukprot:gene14190-16780_t
MRERHAQMPSRRFALALLIFSFIGTLGTDALEAGFHADRAGAEGRRGLLPEVQEVPRGSEARDSSASDILRDLVTLALQKLNADVAARQREALFPGAAVSLELESITQARRNAVPEAAPAPGAREALPEESAFWQVRLRVRAVTSSGNKSVSAPDPVSFEVFLLETPPTTGAPSGSLTLLRLLPLDGSERATAASSSDSRDPRADGASEFPGSPRKLRLATHQGGGGGLSAAFPASRAATAARGSRPSLLPFETLNAVRRRPSRETHERGAPTMCIDRTLGDSTQWLDIAGHDCDAYVTNKWCTDDGGYGPEWSAAWGDFQDWAEENSLDTTLDVALVVAERGAEIGWSVSPEGGSALAEGSNYEQYTNRVQTMCLDTETRYTLRLYSSDGGGWGAGHASLWSTWNTVLDEEPMACAVLFEEGKGAWTGTREYTFSFTDDVASCKQSSAPVQYEDDAAVIVSDNSYYAGRQFGHLINQSLTIRLQTDLVLSADLTPLPEDSHIEVVGNCDAGGSRPKLCEIDGVGRFAMFSLESNARRTTLTLRHVAMINARTHVVWNNGGLLTMAHCEVRRYQGEEHSAVHIQHGGSGNITDSVFAHNTNLWATQSAAISVFGQYDDGRGSSTPSHVSLTRARMEANTGQYASTVVGGTDTRMDISDCALMSNAGKSTVLLEGGVQCHVAGSIIQSNRADMDDGNGGFAYLSGPGINITMHRCTLQSNRAEGHGGVVYLEANAEESSLAVTQCALRNNTAGQSGGDVYVAAPAAAVSLEDSKVSRSQAGDSGGSMFMDGDDVTVVITDSVIENCSAAASTAVLYLGGRNAVSSVTRCFFHGNSGPLGQGGVARVLPANAVQFDECFFENNSANSGGVLHVDAATAGVSRSVAKRNEAYSAGGVVSSTAVVDVVIEDSVLVHNK